MYVGAMTAMMPYPLRAESCAALFSRGLVPVDRLLQELEMRKDDVDEVVLVGGTTRVPRCPATIVAVPSIHTLTPLPRCHPG